MTITTCRHCGEPIFWFARHSRWLHRTSQTRWCATAPAMQAEPLGAPVPAREPQPA